MVFNTAFIEIYDGKVLAVVPMCYAIRVHTSQQVQNYIM